MSVDLCFALNCPTAYTVGAWREAQWTRLLQLAAECAPLDEMLWNRMPAEVCRVSSGLRFGLLPTLMHLVRWPDWQLLVLFVKGFNVVDDVLAANIYRAKKGRHICYFNNVNTPEECDTWNTKLKTDLRPDEFDEIFAATREQREKGLLSSFCFKAELDTRFSKGGWCALR